MTMTRGRVHTLPGAALCGVFFFQAEDGIRDRNVTGVQTCALPILETPILSGRDSTRDQKIARALRRALGKNWCFHFDKPLAVEVIASRFCGPMTQSQIARET